MIESSLLDRFSGYIDGRWAGAHAARTIAVRNPATGERLADVPEMGADETRAAIEAAYAALREEIPIETRRTWLEQTARRMLDAKADLARIITLEQGKPLKESSAEVEYAASFFQFFAQSIDHLQPRRLPRRVRNMDWTVHHRPAGVVGLITPWNFPLAMLAKKLSAAIATGCCAVVKPADLTPLTCVALWRLMEPLNLPAGRVNLIIGKPTPIGEMLCSHPAVRLISFTGSTAVGRLLIRNSAPYVKRLALELGGNAPYIVMEDADVDAAADALMANKFRCAGQTCVCANRIYVQRGGSRAFTDAIASRVERLRVGNGMDPDTDIGPLINRAGFEKVHRHVTDAMSRGAMRIVGSDRPAPANDSGAFYSPTVLTGANGQMLLAKEETFGPVVAIETFDTDAQSIELANRTEYGLAAYLFSRDVERAQKMIARLRFGHIGLNTGAGPTAEAPFGGMKQSGFGREGGFEGLLEFCETQTVASAG